MRSINYERPQGVNEDRTALFGLPGFKVGRVDCDEFGVRTVHVLTDEEAAAGCPSCGVVSQLLKGRVRTAPQDIPYGDDLISIVWHKLRWRCVQPECARLSFTESVPEVPAGFGTTGRLRRAAGRAVADACRSVAEVAEAFGLSWPTAHAAVSELAGRELGGPEPTLAFRDR